jgi:bacillithiol system protein YtxJ
MKYLTNITQFEELIAHKSDFIVYKHSSTCSISDKACRTVWQIIAELNLDEIYLLDVHMTGILKYEVANIVHVRHESPQVLLFKS